MNTEQFLTYLAAIFGHDFDVLWAGGREVLQGRSPYDVFGFVYPLNLAWFMTPFALLPRETAHLAMIAVSLVLLGRLRPERRVYFFAPVVYCMFIGQIEVILLVLGLTGGWLGLAVATIKPQMGIWLAIFQFVRWWPNDRRKIVYAILAIGTVYLLPFLDDPAWVFTWLSSTPDTLDYVSHSTSLFGIGRLVPLSWAVSAIIVAVIGILVFTVEIRSGRMKTRYWEYVALFNPVSHDYTLSMLYSRIDGIAVLLSWLLLPFGFAVRSGLLMTVIPLYLLIKQERLSRRSMSLRGRKGTEIDLSSGDAAIPIEVPEDKGQV